MNIRLIKQSGFTLTELLVALSLNILVLIALISIFVANLQHYRTVLNTNRLHQQLQSAMDIMSSDIRRAGYWANASNDLALNQNNNPFMASGTDISVGTGNTCILFTYDNSKNGSLPAISTSYDDERYGYRVNSQVLQTRPWGASFSCTASANAWENITDSTVILITNLTFTLNTQTITTGPGTARIILRSVDITLTGRLTSDATVTKTLTEHIRIRNDKFQP
jgi:prepilin peptidase dependent protein B